MSKKRTVLLNPLTHLFSHEVGEYWCDTVLCTKEDFERFYSEQKGLGRR